MIADLTDGKLAFPIMLNWNKGPYIGTGGGKAGTVGSLSTAMKAIFDAQRPAGVTPMEMPATAQKIWATLQG